MSLRLKLILVLLLALMLPVAVSQWQMLGNFNQVQRNSQRDWLVVNTAVYMTLNHALRVAAYFALGFSYAPWWALVCGMVLAGICGSWVGTRLRGLVPQRDFHNWFRLLVSALAVRMILLAL